MAAKRDVGGMLKYYRKLNKLSVREVKKKLEEHDIVLSEKTIYGWESNQNPPSADKFLILCDMYKIPDINLTFLDKKGGSTVTMSHEERVMLEHYRSHPDVKEAVKKLLEIKS